MKARKKYTYFKAVTPAEREIVRAFKMHSWNSKQVLALMRFLKDQSHCNKNASLSKMVTTTLKLRTSKVDFKLVPDPDNALVSNIKSNNALINAMKNSGFVNMKGGRVIK